MNLFMFILFCLLCMLFQFGKGNCLENYLKWLFFIVIHRWQCVAVPLWVPGAPLGVIVELCYQNQRGWPVKCLLCRVFLAPLSRGIGAGVHERIKGNQQIFNLIKCKSGSPDVEKHEIQNVLTVSVKRSYLCSRGLQICFSFATASPVTWYYYACLVRQCQYVNTHRIVMAGRWRRFSAGPDQFLIVFKMNLLLTLLAAVVNTH